jgi:hypothetical protein
VLWIAVLITLALIGAGVLIWRSVHTEPPHTITTPTDTSTTTATTHTGPALSTDATTAIDNSHTTTTAPLTAGVSSTTTTASPTTHSPAAAFVCDEDKLPVCCRDATDPAECRKCKKKLDLPDRCE